MRNLCAAILLTLAAPATADDVTDTIESALQAYQDGDIAYTQEELQFALQLLKQMKAASLADLLPAAQDGWEKLVDQDAAAAFAMMGGAAASAGYTNGSDRFTVTIMVDNPMIASMGAMLSNPAMALASGGKMVRVGREKFIEQDGQIMGMIDNRALIQVEGEPSDAIIAHLKTMDFAALGNFGN